ncbi:uncharacterized protein LOC113794832 [Dermatophagoides pteronyssinus]|uniref:uncharacterized protein LOC113794832 n=1 Tax=Dermatophagoides pteronyssinus TaxID=6956 RepID=UPI003F664184
MFNSSSYLILVTILHVMMIILPIQTMTTTKTQKDEICERLRQNNGSNLNILAVGKTQKRLLLITKDFYVYDTPLESLDSSINKLYLKTQPMKMSEKYPKLFDDQRFHHIKNAISVAFIMNDPDSDWICLAPHHRTGKGGINYDIDNSQVIRGWQYLSRDNDPLALLSTNQICQYYSLQFKYSLLMNHWRCQRGNRVREVKLIKPEDRDSVICSTSTSNNNLTIFVQQVGRLSGIRCPRGNPVHWPIVKGFVTDGKFYLFGRSNIYIFSEDVYHNQGKEYPVEKRSYDSFFNCAGIIPPSALSKSYFFGIIGAIILLLLILMIILWCILVRRRQLSFAHGKTGRSFMMSGKLTKLSTHIASARVHNSFSHKYSQHANQPNMPMAAASNRGNYRPSSGRLSGGSTHITARTGLDRKSNMPITSSSKPNQLKRLTCTES